MVLFSALLLACLRACVLACLCWSYEGMEEDVASALWSEVHTVGFSAYQKAIIGVHCGEQVAHVSTFEGLDGAISISHSTTHLSMRDECYCLIPLGIYLRVQYLVDTRGQLIWLIGIFYKVRFSSPRCYASINSKCQ